MIVCPYCQAQNADGAVYCIRCGQLVGHAPGAGATDGGGEGEQKGLAITALVFGILSLLGCIGIGSLVAIITGAIAMSKAKSQPHQYGGRGMALAGLVMGAVSFLLIPFIGIIAAIAIPSLLRARVSANESMAIGDTRRVISAQAAYAGSNNGAYDTLACLGTPASCIPGYNGPAMLPPELANGVLKGGYTRTLHLGPPAAEITEAMSPSSVASYAYVSVPATRNTTGVRGFCGDARGMICYTADGSDPEVVDGECQVGDRCLALR
jgi:type II secretory pathway pseudopilin PulG